MRYALLLAAVALAACEARPLGTCYVELGQFGGFALRQRTIGFDRTIGVFSSPGDAIDAARVVGCEVIQ